MNRNCKNDPDRFCYICGHVVFLDSQAKITDIVKKTYEEVLWSETKASG